MRHLPILLNLLSLSFGLVCLARLVFAYSLSRDRATLARILFFASYTYLLSAGFLFSYYLINLGQSYRAETIFAGLIFMGMAAVELTFPPMVAPSPSAAMRRKPVLSVVAALTALQAPVMITVDRAYAMIPLGLAFTAFFATIAFSIASARRAERRAGAGRLDVVRDDAGARGPLWRGSRALLAYVPVVAIAVVELACVSRPGSEGTYALLSLPLAYALTSFQFLKASPALEPDSKSGVPSRLPGELVRRSGLSPREEEIAALILQGKDNKEIAAALSLSGNTVRNHIYGLYRKLGIQRRMDLLSLIRDFHSS
jgi:DNA-binding CsgD family transcriptional regulator